MAHRIRETWATETPSFAGPLEIDETYIGGREGNKHADKKLNAGRGTVGKSVVAGAKDRESGQVSAQVVTDVRKDTLHGFVEERAAPDATVYTDDLQSYQGIPLEHESVSHSVSEYVRDQAHVRTYNRIRPHSSLGYRPPAPEALLPADPVPVPAGLT